MSAMRVRFKRDIVAEVVAPSRKSRRVIVLLDGLPTKPSKGHVMKFWAKKGWWVVHPRYRGTWESAGEFLKESPEKDVVDVVDGLSKPLNDLWDGTTIDINPTKIVLMGSSFGGCAALLSSRDARVDKVVALSPVVDWKDDSKIEPLDLLAKLTRRAFGEVYRFTMRDWNKLKTGRFFNPVNHLEEMDGSKLLVFHSKDDEMVPARSVEKFAKKTGATLKMYKRGGHFGSSAAIDPKFVKWITRHLKN